MGHQHSDILSVSVSMGRHALSARAARKPSVSGLRSWQELGVWPRPAKNGNENEAGRLLLCSWEESWSGISERRKEEQDVNGVVRIWRRQNPLQFFFLSETIFL